MTRHNDSNTPRDPDEDWKRTVRTIRQMLWMTIACLLMVLALLAKEFLL